MMLKGILFGIMSVLLWNSAVLAGDCYIKEGALVALDQRSMEIAFIATIDKDTPGLVQIMSSGKAFVYGDRRKANILNRDGDYVAFQPIMDRETMSQLSTEQRQTLEEMSQTTVFWTVVPELECY